MDFFLDVMILMLLAVVNGVFSMSEVAVVSSNKVKLEQESEKNDPKAKQALNLINSPDRFLSTVQIGITLIGIVSGTFGGVRLSSKVAPLIGKISWLKPYSETLATVLVIFFITYLSTVVGELVPKRIGLYRPEGIAKYMARPMQLISRISAPFVLLLSKTTELIAKVFHIKKKEEDYNDEDVKTIIEKGAEKGAFEQVEHEVVENLFYLSDRKVGSLMKRRKDVVMLNIDDPEQIKAQLAEHPHYIFPVFEGSSDKIIGVLNTRNLLADMLTRGTLNYKEHLDLPLFVHDKMEALKLLEEFRKTEADYAVVMDEFGQFQGIVTLRDLFESLVGTLQPEKKEETDIQQRNEHSWLVDGSVPFKKIVKTLELPMQEHSSEKEYFTIAGFALHQLGHIPHPGEKFEWLNHAFEVVDLDGVRIDKIMVSRIPKKEAKRS